VPVLPGNPTNQARAPPPPTLSQTPPPLVAKSKLRRQTPSPRQ
jgi:hypothetical protein